MNGFETVGIGAANMMEMLRDKYGDNKVDVKVLLITDVAHEDEDGTKGNKTHYWTSDIREWVVESFLAEMAARIEAKRERQAEAEADAESDD